MDPEILTAALCLSRGERKELAIRVSRIPDLGSRESLLPGGYRVGPHGCIAGTGTYCLSIR